MTGRSVNARGSTLRGLSAAILLMSPGWAHAAAESTEHQLERLRTEIQALRSELESVLDRKLSAEDQLRITEKNMWKINVLLRALDSKIKTRDAELAQLTRQRATAQSSVQKHKNAMALQVRSDYLLGRQPYLKLLLNQQQPQKLARTVAYYNYLHRARLARIEQLNHEVVKLRQVEQAISATGAELANDHQEKLAEKQRLEDYRQQRLNIVASLNAELNQKDSRLKRLLEDEQRVTALVQQLQSELVLEPVAKRPFPELRGQLNWPVRGTIKERFGSDRNIGQLKWQGVMIASQAGAEVRAVSHGRVAFAEWFRGFGLLMILDHGGGYMTLYGYNESLFKEHGDWVEANEVIARVGPGSGISESGLYFEIRHNGKPINPTRWCKN